MVKNYGIHDEWKDLNKVNDIDIKSVDGVIDSIKVNGEEAGGGGGGEFRTATVKFKVQGDATDTNGILIETGSPEAPTPNPPLQGIPYINGNYYSNYESGSISGGTEIDIEILFLKDNGVMNAFIDDRADEATVEGDAEIIDDQGSYTIVITGDCTITAVGSK